MSSQSQTRFDVKLVAVDTLMRFYSTVSQRSVRNLKWLDKSARKTGRVDEEYFLQNFVPLMAASLKLKFSKSVKAFATIRIHSRKIQTRRNKRRKFEHTEILTVSL